MWLVFSLLYTSPVVVVVLLLLESDFIANSAELNFDLG